MRHVSAKRRGMVLLAVLWVVAAMGLAVTGIVKMVRSEIKAAGMQRQPVACAAKFEDDAQGARQWPAKVACHF